MRRVVTPSPVASQAVPARQDWKRTMDNFEKRMQQIEYNEAVKAARAYLGAKNYDQALREASRAAALTGVENTDEAHDLIVTIRKAVDDQAAAAQRQQAEALIQKERKTSQKASTGLMRVARILGVLALLYSVSLLAVPIAQHGFEYFVNYIDIRRATYLGGGCVVFYTLTAFFGDADPLGGVVLPIVWAAILTFFTAIATCMAYGEQSTHLWPRWAKLLVVLVVLILVATAIGSSARKAFNK